MPTTTPNPAELAEQIKRLSGALEVTCCIAGIYNSAPSTLEMDRATLHAAIDQLRDLASGPSAGAEAEPVAWIWQYADKEEELVFLKPSRVQHLDEDERPEKITPLYTAPAATPPAEKEVRVQLSEVPSDTQDAERWRELLRWVCGVREASGRCAFSAGIQPLPGANIMQGSLAEHFTRALDYERAARAASSASTEEKPA